MPVEPTPYVPDPGLIVDGGQPDDTGAYVRIFDGGNVASTDYPRTIDGGTAA